MEEIIIPFVIFFIAFLSFKSCSSGDVDSPKEREQILAIEINQAIESCFKNGGVSMMYVEHTGSTLSSLTTNYQRHAYARCGDGAIFRWKLVNPSTTTSNDETIVLQ